MLMHHVQPTKCQGRRKRSWFDRHNESLRGTVFKADGSGSVSSGCASTRLAFQYFLLSLLAPVGKSLHTLHPYIIYSLLVTCIQPPLSLLSLLKRSTKMHFMSIFVIAAVVASAAASPIRYPYSASHQSFTQPVHGNKAISRSDSLRIAFPISHYEPPRYVDCSQMPGHECPRPSVPSRRQEVANKDQSGSFLFLLPLLKNLFGREDTMHTRDFVEVLSRQDVTSKDQSGSFLFLIPLLKNLFGREDAMFARDFAEVLARQDVPNKDQSGSFLFLLPLLKNLFSREDTTFARNLVEILAHQDAAN
jgi:hypothetical protein